MLSGGESIPRIRHTTWCVADVAPALPLALLGAYLPRPLGLVTPLWRPPTWCPGRAVPPALPRYATVCSEGAELLRFQKSVPRMGQDWGM